MNPNQTICLCRVCGSDANYIFDGEVLGKYVVKYYECNECGYIQTEEPYWLEHAYRQSITPSDTGIMLRNQYNARLVLATLYILNNLDGSIVDYAGGYGILVRLLRDYGVDALWSDRYSKNLLASGFEYASGPAHLVTAFEAFEHFIEPSQELKSLLKISPNVLLSTELVANQTPAHDAWWYYGSEHGQHIGFFRTKTLEKMAAQNGKKLITDGRSYHLFTDQDVDLWKWRVTRKLVSFMPGLISRRLKSKVWSDHLHFSEKDVRTKMDANDDTSF
ncbi:MAG: methyltransferase domain-containing protein [Polynucleobacter sp.]|uniref:class I SAM-dependent methyltransferase n=1 Tax=Polynucleobacter sp. TaxID=2029855 RepID=UPI002723CC32|nr:class I SAM-dependent methyltransferase [Polynucleobacter sp.]MDO8713800.1 methyltransferase domain-containing protein [Polynucleobacter sp.]